jgi:hypothetical protein
MGGRRLDFPFDAFNPLPREMTILSCAFDTART